MLVTIQINFQLKCTCDGFVKAGFLDVYIRKYTMRIFQVLDSVIAKFVLANLNVSWHRYAYILEHANGGCLLFTLYILLLLY